jgi:hypothetical protein
VHRRRAPAGQARAHRDLARARARQGHYDEAHRHLRTEAARRSSRDAATILDGLGHADAGDVHGRLGTRTR